MESTSKGEPNLFLFEDELEDRPHIKSFLESVTNYQNTIPPATDPDAKPPPPSARMGKLYQKIIWIEIHYYLSRSYYMWKSGAIKGNQGDNFESKIKSLLVVEWLTACLLFLFSFTFFSNTEKLNVIWLAWLLCTEYTWNGCLYHRCRQSCTVGGLWLDFFLWLWGIF